MMAATGRALCIAAAHRTLSLSFPYRRGTGAGDAALPFRNRRLRSRRHFGRHRARSCRRAQPRAGGARAAVCARGIGPPPIGQGAKALLRRGLAATGEAPESLVEAGFPIFLDFYGANIARGTRAYPGMEAALDALAAQEVALAICTNKTEALTRKLIEALGWQGRFKAVVGGDTLAVRKPDPAPLREAIARAGYDGSAGRAAFVGDSITDADTARAAGLPFVAVRFGFSDRPVEQLGADRIIDSYGALGDALASLDGWTAAAYRPVLAQQGG
jgi:phosphoglycolate phosphatase